MVLIYLEELVSMSLLDTPRGIHETSTVKSSICKRLLSTSWLCQINFHAFSNLLSANMLIESSWRITSITLYRSVVIKPCSFDDKTKRSKRFPGALVWEKGTLANRIALSSLHLFLVPLGHFSFVVHMLCTRGYEATVSFDEISPLYTCFLIEPLSNDSFLA